MVLHRVWGNDLGGNGADRVAFIVLVVIWHGSRSPLEPLVTPSLLNDLGSLLLTFLMLWAYMAYFQYLLIWSGNLTEEIPWFVHG